MPAGTGGVRSAAAAAAAALPPGPSWTLEELCARPEEFRRQLQLGVLAGCCVEVRCEGLGTGLSTSPACAAVGVPMRALPPALSLPQVRGVVMLEVPEDEAHVEARQLRFESIAKRYFLHFVYSDGEGDGEDAAAVATAAAAAKPAKASRWRRGGGGGGGAAGGGMLPGMVGAQAALLRAPAAHYGGGAPYEALFEGFFPDLGAAKQYIALFRAEAG
jgi:hypothetical protein